MDFTLADNGMPVGTSAVAECLDQVAPGAVQRIPIHVEGQPGSFEVLNLLRIVHCLDESATTIQCWTPEDGRPDKVGQYRMVFDEVIDRAKAADAPLFRLGGWRITIVCSDRVKRHLEASRFTGPAFRELGVR